MHPSAPALFRRLSRPLAALLAVLLAATALVLTPLAPANAEPVAEPVAGPTVDLVPGDPAAPVWQTTNLGVLRSAEWFSLTLQASDATEYSLVEGELPPGLTLAGGVISGVPAARGDYGPYWYGFTVAASGPGGVTNQTFMGSVRSPNATWLTERITPATLGAPYEFQLEAEYADEFVLHGGAMPPGLTLEQDGRIHGTPTQVGTFALWLEAGNIGSGHYRSYDLVVYPPAPVWQTTDLGFTRVDVPLTTQLEATDATHFAVTGGTLPAGLDLVGDTVTGTPTAHGPYDVTITASHSGGETAQRFTGTVEAGTVGWVTPGIPDATVGYAIDLQLEATHAVEFELASGALPEGITLDPDGRLHGTPTRVEGVYAHIRGVNADGQGVTRPFSMVVRDAATWVGETTFELTAGEELDIERTVVRGGWITDVNVQPAGLVAAEVLADTSLQLEALTAGTATVTVTFTNGPQAWTEALTVTVLERPEWVTESLGDLRAGTAVHLELDAPGATEFEITEGRLPSGLTLDDGVLTGTPETHGPYDVTIAASNGHVQIEQRFTGVVADRQVEWVTESFGPLEVGLVLDDAFDADNAASFVLVSGALPTGLTLEADGSVHGTVTESGRFESTISAANADGDGVTRTFTIDVREVPVWTGETSFLMTAGNGLLIPETVAHGSVSAVAAADDDILEVSLAAGGGIELVALDVGTTTVTVTMWNGVAAHTQDLTVEVRDEPDWQMSDFGELREGVPFSIRLDATDATGYAVTDGGLPAGLILDDGVVVGTPETFGPYDVTIAASNGDVQVAQRFTGVVSAPLVQWTTESLPTLDRNVTAELPLDAVHAVEFELTDGDLPSGIELVQQDPTVDQLGELGAWVLAGTPTEAGTFAFELTARNATGDAAPRAFELVVEQPELTLRFAGEPGDEASGIEIEADGSGLAPSSGWSVTVHSDPIELASGATSAEGIVAASATLPGAVPFGAHELRFAATGADGVDVSTSVWFSVGEDGRIVEVSTAGPVGDPPRRSVPAPDPASAPSAQTGGEIARTGVEPSVWLMAALALVLAGFACAAFAASRRTARAD